MDIEKIKEEMTNIRAKADRGENAEASVISGRLIRKIKEEIKEAKKSGKEVDDLKERVFGTLDTVKETGLLVATPVIYAAKFIVNHWYLIFLLLSLFHLPKFGKDKDKKDKDKMIQS